LRVIGGFHVDPAQSNDFGPTDNPDVLSAGGSVKPAAQILFRIGYSESLHRVFIQSLKRLVNPLLGDRKSKFENRKSKIEIRNSKSEIGNSKMEI
jgi:hypothetical protein